jgi:hypothetical protein
MVNFIQITTSDMTMLEGWKPDVEKINAKYEKQIKKRREEFAAVLR